jgi:hypothetical protein
MTMKPVRAAKAALFVGVALWATGGPLAVAPTWAQPQDSELRRLNQPRGGLAPFRSDRELRAWLDSHEPEPPPAPPPPPPPPPPAPPPPPPPAGSSATPSPPPAAGSTIVTGARVPQPNLTSPSAIATVSGESPSITNNQEAGVDEGDIVKIRGNNLVILRRGRLFTVSLAGDGLRPIDSINAFPPDVSGRRSWYDEMLVSGDLVVVIGYSYDRGGTEINRFRLSPDGDLSFLDAYHLSSNDYYSSRNYASRLIGNRLIIYTPSNLGFGDGAERLEDFPGVRRWRGDPDGAFQRILGARQVYKPPRILDREEVVIDTIHTLVDCNITAPTLDCSGTGVLGPESRTFYVSSQAVYLWITGESGRGDDDEAVPSFMYRLPLDRGRPAAVAVRGGPVDQFSFREDYQDGLINVVVRSEGGGDAMWRPEVTEGDVALLRLPIRQFGDGSREARPSFYRPLPKIEGSDWNFHNRFVGRHLLYGAGGYRARQDGATLVVAPLDGEAVAELELAHAVDRLEILGNDGLVVGGGNDALGFTAIELDGRAPRVGDLYRLPDAEEGETRSHAFFYDPETPDGRTGLLGLPVARRIATGERSFFPSAAMLFLSRDNRRFSPAGELAAEIRSLTDDNCQASCVDWYGNARPIFLGDRVFALLGYELVEGRRDGRRIAERRRVSFAPSAPARAEGN